MMTMMKWRTHRSGGTENAQFIHVASGERWFFSFFLHFCVNLLQLTMSQMKREKKLAKCAFAYHLRTWVCMDCERFRETMHYLPAVNTLDVQTTWWTAAADETKWLAFTKSNYRIAVLRVLMFQIHLPLVKMRFQCDVRSMTMTVKHSHIQLVHSNQTKKRKNK